MSQEANKLAQERATKGSGYRRKPNKQNKTLRHLTPPDTNRNSRVQGHLLTAENWRAYQHPNKLPSQNTNG